MKFEELSFRQVVVADKFGQGKIIRIDISRSAPPKDILAILRNLKQGTVNYIPQTDTYVFDSVLTTQSFRELNKS